MSTDKTTISTLTCKIRYEFWFYMAQFIAKHDNNDVSILK